MAGFSLSRALFRKNVGPLTWGGRSYFSWKKLRPFLVITVCQLSVLQCHPYWYSPINWRPFIVITVAFIHFTRSLGVAHFVRHVAMLQKLLSSCGGHFLWGALFGRTCWTCLNPPLEFTTKMFAQWLPCCDLCTPTSRRNYDAVTEVWSLSILSLRTRTMHWDFCAWLTSIKTELRVSR